jgi:hypothetical protein
VSEWGETDLYADIKELIGTVSDDDFKESLVQKIQYLNEYSLRKRLADILTRFDSIIAIFVSDKAALINDAVATRNYLTHFSERLKERAKFGGSLYTLCTRLQHILEICLMAEIGIPEAKITELIRRNRRIGLVAQRSNTTAV